MQKKKNTDHAEQSVYLFKIIEFLKPGSLPKHIALVVLHTRFISYCVMKMGNPGMKVGPCALELVMSSAQLAYTQHRLDNTQEFLHKITNLGTALPKSYSVEWNSSTDLHNKRT